MKNPLYVLSLNFVSIGFMILCAYCLNIHETGFAVTSLIFSLLTSHGIYNKKDEH